MPKSAPATAVHSLHEGVGRRDHPRCAECGDVWLAANNHCWQAHRIDDEPELRFWCPPCAEREFAGG